MFCGLLLQEWEMQCSAKKSVLVVVLLFMLQTMIEGASKVSFLSSVLQA